MLGMVLGPCQGAIHNAGGLFQANLGKDQSLGCQDILDKEWPALKDPRLDRLLVITASLCSLERLKAPLSDYARGLLGALLAAISCGNLGINIADQLDDSPHFSASQPITHNGLFQRQDACQGVEHGLSCWDVLQNRLWTPETPQVYNFLDYVSSWCVAIRALQREKTGEGRPHIPLLKVLAGDLLELVSFLAEPGNEARFGEFYLKEQEEYDTRVDYGL